MDRVRFGIIGMGIMGTNHATWFKQGKVEKGVVTAVCDIDPARRQWAKENLDPSVKIYEDYHDLLKCGLVDAVIIATPHYLHPVIGIEALGLGLHVLSEKPAGVYTKKVRELYEVAAKHPKQVFGLMYNERTNPVFRKAKEMVESSAIGNIRRATWMSTAWWRPQKYYDSSSWRATWAGEGGGVLINQGPHQIDLMQWICGMPVKVQADLKYGSHRKIDVEDDATVHFTYENGATGNFIICTHDVLGTNNFEIFGDKGKITIENSAKLTARILHEDEPSMNTRMSFEEAKKIINGSKLDNICNTMVYDEHNVFGVQHQIVLNDYCNAVLTGSPLFVPGTEGIKGLIISNAIHLSSWLGKEVEIPFDEDLFYYELQKKIKEEEESKAK